jgi:hypothetical protein
MMDKGFWRIHRNESNDDFGERFSRIGHITGPLAGPAAENKPFP